VFSLKIFNIKFVWEEGVNKVEINNSIIQFFILSIKYKALPYAGIIQVKFSG